MAVYTTPVPVSTGELATAAVHNVQVLDNIVHLHDRIEDLEADLAASAFVPTGVVIWWAKNSAQPTGYLECNGQAVSRTTYAALFAIFGTNYGVGDGSTTFNLPNTAERVIVGKAPSGDAATVGNTGGAFNHTHTGPLHAHTSPAHLHNGPSHTHDMANTTGFNNPNQDGGAGDTSLVEGGDQRHTHSIVGFSGPAGDGATSLTAVTTDAAGNGATGAANQAYLVLMAIIKT